MSSCYRPRQLVGRVVAKSHRLFTKPQSFLLQLSDHDGEPHYLLIDRKDHLKWNKHFVINKKYLFTGLRRIALRLEDERFPCWKTTETTKWTLSQSQKLSCSTESVSLQDSSSNSLLSTISGIVTHVDPLVGLLTIDDKYDIILAYQQPCSLLPQLYKGQNVAIHNIHVTVLTPEKSLGVLCTRGFVEVICDAKQPSEEENILGAHIQSPLVMYVEDLQIGVEGLFWMHEEARRQYSAFPSSFFSEHGLTREDEDALREKMLKDAIYYLIKNSYNGHPPRKMVGEFIKSDHSCLPMREFSPVYHSVSPSSCQENKPDVDEDSSLTPLCISTKVGCLKKEAQQNMSQKLANYDLGLMIGFLKPATTQSFYKEASFCLVDGCSSFPCVITSEKKIVDPSDCQELCYTMVMSEKCFLVQQKLELKSVEGPLHIQFLKMDLNDIVSVGRFDCNGLR